MILVSGAAGKTGQAVVGALVARGARVRGLVRRAEQESVVRKAGGAEVVVGDMLAGEAWERGVAGTTAVYHIPPNMHPDELKIGQLAIAAAGAAKVRCFGYHSVLWPQTEAMPHHWQKLRVEELLLRSGLAYVMVQPSAYMQNLAAMRARVVQEGVLAAPYGAESRLSLVDLGDVAEVVARLLVDEGLWYGSYGLCGTRGLSQREVAAEWGAVLGRVVRAER
ncbi:MAG TPA: NmrA family NAD(P)-binding protein, partial [Anaerolineae bacterium]|nr:NmrA family NAD(P)-binding protein [Anaerolineae bacterium]